MLPALARTASLAAATWRDLLRRPGAWLAFTATAILVLIVPRVARRALDDGSALGTELVLSTVWLHATVLAGVIAARAADPGSAHGLTVELLATPLRRGEYVVARWLGISATAWTHAALLLVLGLTAVALAGDVPHLDGIAAVAIPTGVVQVALLTAAGLAAGCALGPQLGLVLIIAYMVAARVAIPALTETNAAWSWLLPDVARADVAREVAFGRPLGTISVVVAAAAGLVQAAALLLLARAAIGIAGSRDGRSHA